MLPFKIKIEWKKKAKTWTDLPRFGRKVFITAVVVSILVHLISFVRLQSLTHDSNPFLDGFNKRPPIRITLKDEKKKDSKKEDDEEKKAKKILETQQTENEKPKDSRYLGNQDHSTDKETRVKENTHPKAADVGQQGAKKQDQKTAKETNSQKDNSKKPSSPLTSDLKITGNGTLGFGTTTNQKPRNKYEELLPTNENDLPGQINAGYQDLVDENAIVSERINMNTTSYRFIGYFTGFRKQIELVWIYPTEAARRGIQGEVQLEIIIEKTGHVSRIKVIKSSGHTILDEAMVATIRQAAPFSPIPPGMKKERLVVVGSFRYILTAYAGSP